ncbi:vitamin B12 import ATP-binding protein BtuD [Microbulbifer aestuariivivens]|uniref:Vitamin B12 import ATP-binding protein BtuD n=1 Tax=Microbulbifer aestuariivivens TaxID=1908308 RepID=A0ABP9WN77_9GAMM
MNISLPLPRECSHAAQGAGVESGLSVGLLRTAVNPETPWQFELPKTGIFGLTGPSGGGKSTLLEALSGHRCCSGIVKFSGTVWQDGKKKIPSYKRNLTLGFQDARLFNGQTVSANLALAHRFSRRPLSTDNRQQLTDAFEISDLLAKPVETLSGGESQRVALVRQLFSNAAVQFFDEPLSAVDRPRVLRRLIPVLKAFWSQNPSLVLWVSHDLDEIQLLSGKCLYMEAGKLDGPDSTTEKVQNLHSAGFVQGVSCRLQARVISCEHGILTLALGQHRLYADRFITSYKPEDDATFLINSGEVSLSIERPGLSSILNCLPVKLLGMVPITEGRVRLRISVAEQEFCCDISRLSQQRLNLRIGDHYYAQFKAGSLVGL